MLFAKRMHKVKTRGELSDTSYFCRCGEQHRTDFVMKMLSYDERTFFQRLQSKDLPRVSILSIIFNLLQLIAMMDVHDIDSRH